MRDIWTFQYRDRQFVIHSSYVASQHVVYRVFLLFMDDRPVFKYQLGITRVAWSIYDHKRKREATTFLMDWGCRFIEEMVRERSFTRSSGVITSHELSMGKMDWRNLEPLDTNKKYIQ